MPTERLDRRDPALRAFEARVLRHGRWGERPTLVLDASAFYPESGGQLGDRGRLGALEVVDTQIDDAGDVHHLVEGGPLPSPGARVEATLDDARRREHMALHTAQHVLSRALEEVAGATTVSARLGERAATIDTARTLSERQRREAEALAQEIADADRPVRALTPSPEELARLSLRRAPKVAPGTQVRLIEVEGFDRTPCGGTHVARTAQLGTIQITDLVGHKAGSRVTFVAGLRARRRLLHDAAALRALGGRFSCAPADVALAVDKLERQLADAREALGAARAGWAEAILAGVDPAEARWVQVLAGLDVDTVRQVATRWASEGAREAVLAAPTEGGLHVVAARGPESELDCGALVKALAKRLGGGGGGRPERAEGRLKAPADLDLAAALDGA
ncbi:MAG TPA: alanyl-tRNA editing protein [Polyangiaceae bacterium LLY-WYZ-15_(1-7)]|nr:alanyl-tRNA editing protein [Myxococcales bacterium]MAT27962.1 alanyl-tRNA editing protein [Sandaracinus sp.]MBJ71236.1 alanyl-tRNA editing protein [Sandaracinus sp.]HJL06108.1 alanyl-tRNA editing protein [Polyangiaceae bacterium LLY-WYZ-15_(1-7)]HJL06966.1 alanyl-tRNA editing protein [Polyangiaceae bacterium LLY-WYZ-15_(1-7)]